MAYVEVYYLNYWTVVASLVAVHFVVVVDVVVPSDYQHLVVALNRQLDYFVVPEVNVAVAVVPCFVVAYHLEEILVVVVVVGLFENFPFEEEEIRQFVRLIVAVAFLVLVVQEDTYRHLYSYQPFEN